MQRIIAALALVFAFDAQGQAINTPSTQATITTPISGAPSTYQLIGTLTKDQRRVVSLTTGGPNMSFLDQTGKSTIFATGRYNANHDTLVCAQYTAGDPASQAGPYGFECGVRVDGDSTVANRFPVDTAPGAFFNDLCVGASGFTVLYTIGSNPFANESGRCFAKTWNRASGWTTGVDSVCSCDIVNGTPCTDACFTDKGTFLDGVCTGMKAPACTSSDPTKVATCSGDPANLCSLDPAPDPVVPAPVIPAPAPAPAPVVPAPVNPAPVVPAPTPPAPTPTAPPTSSASVAQPVITCVYSKYDTCTMTSSTANTTIYYSMSGAPTTADSHVANGIAISGPSVYHNSTLRAIACVSGQCSAVSSLTTP